MPECVSGAIHGHRAIEASFGAVTNPGVTAKDFVDVSRRMESHVVAGLLDIRSIVQTEKAQPFDGFVEAFIKEVTEFLVGGGVVNRNGEVVDLTQKEDRMSVDGTSVDTGLVGGRDKAQILQDCGDVAFPETGRFRVTL
jgi:hypothetical protein